MPAPRLTVVVSQGQSHHPAKRKLEEAIVGSLLGHRGIEVTVVPHLYDLAPEGTGMLCLRGITGPMVVLSWLYPRAAHWILNRMGIQGQAGQTVLSDEGEEEGTEGAEEEAGEGRPQAEGEDQLRVSQQWELPARRIYCLDLRSRADAAPFIAEIERIADELATATVELSSWLGGDPPPDRLQRFLQPAAGNVASGQASEDSSAPPQVVAESTDRRWYPVIDFSRCTNCLECIDFCLFGVYGIDSVDTILVEQPDNCRKGCPACSRVCPENAIIFPQHKTPAIAGSNDVAASLKIDLSKLFGAPGADAVDMAVRERDEQLLLTGRQPVGKSVGLATGSKGPADQPPDEWDQLLDQLDGLDL